MRRKNLHFALALGIPTILSSAAQADTKAGVDAWTRGDYDKAIKEWQAEAAKGDADAIFDLGQAYKLGKGVPQDLAKAEDLFSQAAGMGHLQAADNYGLLLFQRGEHAMALPYIHAAADRGDPRAQYLLGIMHFNGELVPKDWVRAYALVTLAQQQGLPQAKSALAQMDEYIPLDQRQQGIQLSGELGQEADATRARQLAGADLGSAVPGSAAGAAPAPAPSGTPVSSAKPRPVTARTDPTPAGLAPPRAAKPASRPPIAAAPVATNGTWRIQFGAFGVAANADALWARLRNRPEVAGHPRLNVKAGAVIKLQAGGYSESAAQAACARLKAAGFTCVALPG